MAIVAGAYVLSLVARGLLKNLAHYYLFRSIPGLGENVKIKINGAPGTISAITKRLIRIDLDDGDELLIPIVRFQYQTWIIRKDKK